MVRPADPTDSGLWGLIFCGTAFNMVRVSAYIDGFNLYHALTRFKDDRVKWLNLKSLVNRLILPKSERIVDIYYFSAYAHWLPPGLFNARYRPLYERLILGSRAAAHRASAILVTPFARAMLSV
jgi:hypothetical protein